MLGISLSDDSIALTVSILSGSLHCLLLFVAVRFIALGSPLRREGVRRGAFAAHYELRRGALQALGSLRRLTPSWLNAPSTTALLFWMIVVGLWLRSRLPFSVRR